jgi:UDP-hydrolysing UDP-N-acetyl-D-glucosamine 2-epimerase
MKKRLVAVFTGNRAEYGLQFPILRAINKHPNLDYHLIVSGAHLDHNFGRTLEEIKSDGFRIDAEVKIQMEEDAFSSTAQAIGSGVIEISKVLSEIRPDIVVVYADRFEGFAAVIASTQMNIPTAHIEGGDLTEGGALDDSVRHAMTKLAHVHFTTNQQASNRILAMGEESWRVHTVGFPAIDLISEGNYATSEELVNRFGLDLSRPIVLFTQHSVTTEFDQAESQLLPSLKAIEKLAGDGVQIILTYPNNDVGGKKITSCLEDFYLRKINNVQLHRSLGRYYYHGILGLARNRNFRIACVGNSSSGIKETPAFGCPTVNIGSRQEGRLRAVNVIDAKYDVENIYRSIKKCLFDEEVRAKSFNTENPYGIGDAGPKIAEILANVSLDQSLLRKKMFLKGEVSNGWYR